MPTVTIYADSDGGHIYGDDFTSSYATARSTATGVGDTNTNATIGQKEQFGGINFQVFRYFVRFDTSSIPAGATITGASLYICALVDESDTDFLIRCYRYAWSSPLAGSPETNYDGAYGGSATLEGTFRDTASGLSADTYYSMAVDTAGINTSGFTGYVLVSKEDVDNSAPSGNELVGVYTANETGTSKDPYLSITYTLPGVPNGLMLMGCGA